MFLNLLVLLDIKGSFGFNVKGRKEFGILGGFILIGFYFVCFKEWFIEFRLFVIYVFVI